MVSLESTARGGWVAAALPPESTARDEGHLSPPAHSPPSSAFALIWSRVTVVVQSLVLSANSKAVLVVVPALALLMTDWKELLPSTRLLRVHLTPQQPSLNFSMPASLITQM